VLEARICANFGSLGFVFILFTPKPTGHVVRYAEFPLANFGSSRAGFCPKIESRRINMTCRNTR
jgi:hypothetical protein